MGIMDHNAVRGVLLAGAIILGGCATVDTPAASSASAMSGQEQKKFEQDRQAILAMAGDYHVTFDFIETVSFVEGYDLKDRKLSGGNEIVRVIEDTGDFISLQHILVVGGDQKFPIKHWRQDWRYEPDEVLTFVGGNAWVARPVSEAERDGAWSQGGRMRTELPNGRRLRSGVRSPAETQQRATIMMRSMPSTVTPSRRMAGCTNRTIRSSSCATGIRAS